MRAPSQSILLLSALLASIPYGAAMRVVPDMHAIMMKEAVRDLHSTSNGTATTVKLQAHPHGEPAKMPGYWSHPVVLGVLLGFLLIGPDQLGTIMTLCSLAPDFSSFKVGFSWGLGHSLGMLAICPLFFRLQQVSAHRFDILLSKWEYCGNYFIGLSMLVLAVEFLIYEKWYRKQRSEALEELDENDCAPYSPAAQQEQGKDSVANLDVQNVIDHLGLGKVQMGLEKTQEEENIQVTWFWPSSRSYQAAFVGTLQGLCSPMAITGILLMHRTQGGSSLSLHSAFASVFVLASSIGAGAVALGWGALSTYAFANVLSPRTVYLGSCAATFLLGLCCVAANAAGALHNTDWEGDM